MKRIGNITMCYSEYPEFDDDGNEIGMFTDEHFGIIVNIGPLCIRSYKGRKHFYSVIEDYEIVKMEIL